MHRPLGPQVWLEQSSGRLQSSPSAQPPHPDVNSPPQSTPISAPSFTPFWHRLATQRWVPTLQKPLVQWWFALQPSPTAQVWAHDPPQSRPVSSPLFTPSPQLVFVQVFDATLQ